MMWSNFFKIAMRSLLRNRIYALISVSGLALGIASCLLIFMYVFDEVSYDQYHVKKERIYRINTISHFNGDMVTALTNYGVGPTLKQEYPEVESFVRFRPAGSPNVSIGDKVFVEEDVWMVDSTIFDVFSFELIEGNASTALTAPRSLVLTESAKQRYFGDDLALGKELKMNNAMVTITGVIKDPPANSDLTINMLLSMTTMPPHAVATFTQDWFRIGFYTFLLFEDVPDVADFEEKMVAFEEKYVQPWSAENQIEASHEYHITRLNDVHFQQGLDYDLPKGNMNYIIIFSLLAVFILIIASINYINLSLAQSTKRAKEVGIRKTLGALKKELMSQFLGESILITLIASFFGLALVELLLPTFNDVTQKSFTISALLSPSLVLSMIAMIVLVGLIAGSYPAMILSSFQPVTVLKGVIRTKGGVGFMQKGLILVQFLFSLFMITGTMLISDQLDFMRSMNLGFEKENVMVVNLPADTNLAKQINPWVDDLRNDAGIVSIAHTNVPTGSTGELMFRIEQDGQLEERGIRFFFVDEHFVDVLGLDLQLGRNFDPSIATDQTQAFIINEFAAEAFGWTDEPLGKRVQWGLMPNNQAANDGTVVGVVNNFHFLSLHNPMEPFVLCYRPQGNNMLTVRLAQGDYRETLANIEQEWNALAPNHDFDFTFLDELLEQNYSQEQTMGKLFGTFAWISILIASLGLFALLSFSIQSRIKEIGMRKVLGASLVQISWVLIKDFVLIMLLAFAFVAPLNIYLMNRWLESFAYSVSIQPLTFLTSLMAAMLLSGITISYHIFKLSKSNPVDALRYE